VSKEYVLRAEDMFFQHEAHRSAEAAKNPTERLEQVSTEFITTFPVTKENHDAVMVIEDKITKLVMCIPTRTDMDTMETAQKFFNHWYKKFGLSTKRISDGDGRCISRFWKIIFRLT
jgi:hypothetical protein